MYPKGAQTGPKDPKMEPQGPQVTKEKQQMCTKGVKMEPQVLQWGPEISQSAKKNKKVSRSVTQARNCAAKWKKTNKHT